MHTPRDMSEITNGKKILAVAHLQVFFEQSLVNYTPSNVTDDLERAVFVRKWMWSTQKWA